MDGQRFDRLTRALASGSSRRSVLKGLIGLGGAAAAVRQLPGGAQGGPPADRPGGGCDEGQTRCGGECCPEGQVCCGPPWVCQDECGDCLGCLDSVDGACIQNDDNCTGCLVCNPVGKCVPDDTNCDDGFACTANTCVSDGSCFTTPDHSLCDGCLNCTEGICAPLDENCAECATCAKSGQCVPVPNACDDGNDCTENICDIDNGCQHPPKSFGTPCDDGNPCTESGLCNGSGQCSLGPPISCDGCLECFEGTCRQNDENCSECATCAKSGNCIPDDSACDDGNDCTENICDADSGCQHPPKAVNSPCEDDDPCTVTGQCDGAGQCVVKPPVTCDGCLECFEGTCRQNDEICSECEICAENGDCIPDERLCEGCLGCVDGVCTPVHENCADCATCAKSGECISDDSACDDGNDCTDDVCDPTDGCSNTAKATGAACSTGVCCGDPPACSECSEDVHCEAGFRCSDCSCVPEPTSTTSQPTTTTDQPTTTTTPTPCATDADCLHLTTHCNVGVCSDSTGVCTLTPYRDGEFCSSGAHCVVGERCDAGVCSGGGTRVCDAPPNVQCYQSLGVCYETSGECEYAQLDNGTPCDDGVFCTVGETCQEGECIRGTPRNCQDMQYSCDGGPCDTQCGFGACDEENQQCTFVPSRGGLLCDFGNACVTEARCEAGRCREITRTDCSFLDDQCNDSTCNSVTGECFADAKTGQLCTTDNPCVFDGGGVCDSDGFCRGLSNVPFGTPCGESGSGFTCSGSVCQCGEGMRVCPDGRCIPESDCCVECLPGWLCIDGVQCLCPQDGFAWCVPDFSCHPIGTCCASCAPNEVCVDGVCVCQSPFKSCDDGSCIHRSDCCPCNPNAECLVSDIGVGTCVCLEGFHACPDGRCIPNGECCVDCDSLPPVSQNLPDWAIDCYFWTCDDQTETCVNALTCPDRDAFCCFGICLPPDAECCPGGNEDRECGSNTFCNPADNRCYCDPGYVPCQQPFHLPGCGLPFLTECETDSDCCGDERCLFDTVFQVNLCFPYFFGQF